jgi:predicted SAM-dependent methyltransferase
LTWTPDAPQGNEAAKCKYDIVQYTRGRGLDLGCGPSKAFPHFIGVDNGVDTELFGIQIQPDLRLRTCEKLDMFADGSMDFIFSSHLLEHIEDYNSALKEWWRVITDGGHLVLYLPDEDEYPKVGQPGANPDHKWNVNYERVVEAMQPLSSWDLIEFEKRNQGIEYSLLFVFRKM